MEYIRPSAPRQHETGANLDFSKSAPEHAKRRMESRHLGGADWESRHLGGAFCPGHRIMTMVPAATTSTVSGAE